MVSGAIFSYPKPSKDLRPISQSWSMAEPSAEDERQIFAEPARIPEDFRPKIPSLVWVALLDQAPRESLLSTWSAQDLASVWVADDEILAKLEEVIPEKKKVRIHEYAAKLKPSRQSPIMNDLVKEALELFKNRGAVDESQQSDESQQQAA